MAFNYYYYGHRQHRQQRSYSHGVACNGPGPKGGQLGKRDEEAWVGGDGEGDGGVHLMDKGGGGRRGGAGRQGAGKLVMR